LTETWIEQIVTIPAGASILEAGIVWNTVLAGEAMFVNDFVVTKFGVSSTPEYQYNLKDHLGNVRVTFTTKQDIEAKTATFEAANASAERPDFLRYSNARRIQAAIFDHTNGSSTGFSQRLSGSANEKYGIGRSISVMPGDVIDMEVYAKYVDSNTANWTSALTTLMGQISSGSSSVVFDEAGYPSSTSSFPYGGLITTSPNSGAPKAYLNWLVFDRDFNFINGGFKGMSTSAKENGADVAHEKLDGQLTITEPGYVYIYVSNEETTVVEVYFDDLKVTQTKSPVIQLQDYYPFGLTFNSYSRENSVANQYKYNGMELQDDLGVNWLDFAARMYMPDIGRWNSVDPHSYKYPDYSPFNYCYDNPINVVDRNGKDAIIITFPDYKIDTESPLGVVAGIGHAGVLLIDNKTGQSIYYEYGRYATADGTKGRTRMGITSCVDIGPDGKPTSESLNRVLGEISKRAGKGGRIEGAYIESDNFEAMNEYATEKFQEGNFEDECNYNKDREPYSLKENNCGTFALDVVSQDKNVNGIPEKGSYKTPIKMMDEAQVKFDKVSYDPKTKTTKYSISKESYGKVLELMKRQLKKDEKQKDK
jgi:RHS repeat-associated protein